MSINYPIIGFCDATLAVFNSIEEMRSNVESPDIENGLWQLYDATGKPIRLELEPPKTSNKNWLQISIVDPVYSGDVVVEAVAFPDQLHARLLDYFTALCQLGNAPFQRDIEDLQTLNREQLVAFAAKWGGENGAT